MIARPALDISSSLHDLAGRSQAGDALIRFAASNLIYLALIALAVLWLHRDGLRAGVAAGAGAGIALAVGAGLGAAWDRPRPFVAEHFTPLFDHAADASFPSDHLTVLGAIAAACFLAWRLLGVLVSVLAAGVAVGRVAAGMHYVSDVVAGFALGAAAAIAVWYALRPLLPVLDQLDTRLRAWRLRRVLLPSRE